MYYCQIEIGKAIEAQCFVVSHRRDFLWISASGTGPVETDHGMCSTIAVEKGSAEAQPNFAPKWIVQCTSLICNLGISEIPNAQNVSFTFGILLPEPPMREKRLRKFLMAAVPSFTPPDCEISRSSLHFVMRRASPL